MLPAATFANAIRNHWAIENRSHYVRDVTLAEDASRIRINPGILARLRSYVLNIARANGAENIARALWIAAIDPTVSLSYKGANERGTARRHRRSHHRCGSKRTKTRPTWRECRADGMAAGPVERQ